MPEHEILNNPNVIRCMFFVKEVLEQVQKNGGVVKGGRTGQDHQCRTRYAAGRAQDDDALSPTQKPVCHENQRP